MDAVARIRSESCLLPSASSGQTAAWYFSIFCVSFFSASREKRYTYAACLPSSSVAYGDKRPLKRLDELLDGQAGQVQDLIGFVSFDCIPQHNRALLSSHRKEHTINL